MGNQRTSDRRAVPERRQGDRRRAADTRHAVFELCRSKLNLALIVHADDGDKVVTRSLRWRNTATSLHTERGVEELTEAFKTLVADERLAGATVRIALGGEYCVTRVVTAFSVPLPSCPTCRFGMSPMWNGWLASGSVLLAGPGSKWPPALVNGASHWPTA